VIKTQKQKMFLCLLAATEKSQRGGCFIKKFVFENSPNAAKTEHRQNADKL
jgi:hypothetical protein